MNTEESKGITNYENLYEITRSGKIISLKKEKTLTRCGDEYGFHIVKLSKNGIAKNYNVFELWKKAYPQLNHSEFRGALKAKYGQGGKPT